jgi:hypothetical protein
MTRGLHLPQGHEGPRQSSHHTLLAGPVKVTLASRLPVWLAQALWDAHHCDIILAEVVGQSGSKTLSLIQG